MRSGETAKDKGEVVGEVLGGKEVSIMLPSVVEEQAKREENEDGEEKDLMELVAKIAEAEGSSGATTVPAIGFWSGSNGQQVKQENVTLLKISSTAIDSTKEDPSNNTGNLAQAPNVEATGEISITVPSTIDVDQTLSDTEHESYVFQVIEKLLKVTARATAVPAVGYWVLEEPGAERKLMKEKVTIVSASCVINENTKRVVKDAAEWLCSTLKQEAVFVKLNHEAFLVRDKSRPRRDSDSEGTKEEGGGRREKKTKRKQRRKKYFQLYKLPTLEQHMVHDCCHNEKDSNNSITRKRLWY